MVVVVVALMMSVVIPVCGNGCHSFVVNDVGAFGLFEAAVFGKSQQLTPCTSSIPSSIRWPLIEQYGASSAMIW